MESFNKLYQRAADRKGGESALSLLLSKPISRSQFSSYDDNHILAEFTKKVFMSGFVWRIVEQKWAGFESIFFNFDIEKILMMPDEMLERKAQDPVIIRNFKKVLTIRDNALMLAELARQHGSAAQFIADWPSDDIVGLWQYLKKNGSRLGGNTGPYALRALGKDTFLITQDVEAYFRAQGLVSGGIGSKTNQKVIQNQFNQWQVATGLSLQELSKIIAYANGDNHVGLTLVGST